MGFVNVLILHVPKELFIDNGVALNFNAGPGDHGCRIIFDIFPEG
jgi:hypothetical protein